MKQHFTFEHNGKVYGCSFRKGNYTNTFFGWITLWKSREDYNNPSYNSVEAEAFDIPLTAETKEAAMAELKEYALKTL